MLIYNSLDGALANSRRPFFHLILVVGSPKMVTEAIVDATEANDIPLLNLSLAVAERLLNLTPQQRRLRASAIVEEVLTSGADAVAVDRTALLFEPSLQLKPLALLQRLAKRRTVIAGWPGHVDGDEIVYAEPKHPEFRRIAADDVLVVVV